MQTASGGFGSSFPRFLLVHGDRLILIRIHLVHTYQVMWMSRISSMISSSNLEAGNVGPRSAPLHTSWSTRTASCCSSMSDQTTEHAIWLINSSDCRNGRSQPAILRPKRLLSTTFTNTNVSCDRCRLLKLALRLQARFNVVIQRNREKLIRLGHGEHHTLGMLAMQTQLMLCADFILDLYHANLRLKEPLIRKHPDYYSASTEITEIMGRIRQGMLTMSLC